MIARFDFAPEILCFVGYFAHKYDFMNLQNLLESYDPLSYLPKTDRETFCTYLYERFA